jgi:protein MpaA
VRRSTGRLLPWLALVALLLGLALLDLDDSDVHARTGTSTTSAPRAAPAVRRYLLLGRSVRRRAIGCWILGRPRARPALLAVGVIHGDETAGLAIARQLDKARPPARGSLWIIPDLNPDGVAAGTRQNADGVDLNRNFPYRWRPLGRRGDQQYAGPRPLSEPEARIAARLILRVRPEVTIWFHQPLGITDLSGGNPAVERRFAALSGLPPRRLVRYPGSVAGWENHTLPGHTAFVVELPPRPPRPSRVRRYSHGVLTLLR